MKTGPLVDCPSASSLVGKESKPVAYGANWWLFLDFATGWKQTSFTATELPAETIFIGDAAHVVAREVEQHQVLGMLLGIGQQLVGKLLVLLGRGAAPYGAGERPDGDGVVAQAHQDLGAGAHDREVAVVEEELPVLEDDGDDR